MKESTIYEISESEVTVNETTVRSYGISCRRGDEVLFFIDDLSTNRASIEVLAKKCNELQLEPSQLRDVAEDFVSEP